VTSNMVMESYEKVLAETASNVVEYSGTLE
jgi:hypothetical protein